MSSTGSSVWLAAEQATALKTFAHSGGAGQHDATANRLDMIYGATFHDTIAQLGGKVWLCDALVGLRSRPHMYQLYHHAQRAMRAHLTTAMKRTTSHAQE